MIDKFELQLQKILVSSLLKHLINHVTKIYKSVSHFLNKKGTLGYLNIQLYSPLQCSFHDYQLLQTRVYQAHASYSDSHVLNLLLSD